MKYLYTLILLITIIFFNKTALSQNNELKKHEILNAIEISITPNLELRDKNSRLSKEMDNYRNEYNKVNINKMGKSELIFQPRGTNDEKENAVKNVTRIGVKYIKLEKRYFPKYNKSISSKELSAIRPMLKRQTIQSMNEMPLGSKLIKWNPFETGTINNQNYLRISHVIEIDKEKTLFISYHFHNSYEKVIISFISDFPANNEWTNTLKKVVNTFKFKKKI